MYRKKTYGESKTTKCPFCERPATARNNQAVPVCETHRNEPLRDMKCVCGGPVEILVGKWGPYGKCDRCGNVSWHKILEMSPAQTPSEPLYKEQTKATLSKPAEKPIQNRKIQNSDEYYGPGVRIITRK